jgi:GNAT superfamily N-acetyltransferase
MTRIRPMTDADADRAAELTKQLGYPVDAATLRARLAEVRASDADEILVATDADDAAIGWVHVARLALLEASDLACINGLVVDEEHRSDGIGTALVEAAEAWARDHGATAIMVRSRSARVRAHRFYERVGYVEIKRSHVFEKSLR